MTLKPILGCSCICVGRSQSEYSAAYNRYSKLLKYEKKHCFYSFQIPWVLAHGDFVPWKDNIDVVKGHSTLNHVQTTNGKMIFIDKLANRCYCWELNNQTCTQLEIPCCYTSTRGKLSGARPVKQNKGLCITPPYLWELPNCLHISHFCG